ncbi:MAG: endonuclease/exonuclease/phosphatase family protein [Bdellovibrionales bacterium]
MRRVIDKDVKSLRWIFILGLLVSCQKTTDQQIYLAPQERSEMLLAENISSQLKICSFNIQFLGASRVRETSALSQILKKAGCDMVVVQELIAPPDVRRLPASKYYGEERMPQFPGTNQEWVPNDRSTDFFERMYEAGFDNFEMSEEDTGPGPKNHINSTATEWWVVFFKSRKVEVHSVLPTGFVSGPLAQNPNWDRVPYAFSFRCKNTVRENQTDFTLLSVHLHTGATRANALRRKAELEKLYRWIDLRKRSITERDYFILGDMNIEDGQELTDVTQSTPYLSLNTLARFPTNTNPNNPRPYDHMIYNPSDSHEIAPLQNLQVLDLVKAAKAYWTSSGYPGTPYDHNRFRMSYSDHNPIAFTLSCENDDD